MLPCFSGTNADFSRRGWPEGRGHCYRCGQEETAMDFDSFLSQAWDEHATDAAGVAERLDDPWPRPGRRRGADRAAGPPGTPRLRRTSRPLVRRPRVAAATGRAPRLQRRRGGQRGAGGASRPAWRCARDRPTSARRCRRLTVSASPRWPLPTWPNTTRHAPARCSAKHWRSREGRPRRRRPHAPRPGRHGQQPGRHAGRKDRPHARRARR